MFLFDFRLMLRVCAAIAMGAPGQVGGDFLWPPSLSGPPEAWGSFGSSWQFFSGDLAAHSAEGGRTVARRAESDGRKSRLLVFLPGTFTIPQEFSVLLKFAVDSGFDTIGLDYGWGPAPDSKRSSECSRGEACASCQSNYHEVIATGSGENLVTGNWPVFGENQTETHKFLHFYSHGVQFIPETILPGYNISSSPHMAAKALSYADGLAEFAVEPLLSAVLLRLGWTEYLVQTGGPLWSKVVVAGHSQGASHAAYIGYARSVLGVFAFSGPQDTCGDQGGEWFATAVPDGRRAFACYAEDESGRPAIEKNLAFFSEVRTFNATGKPRKYGQGAWCASPEHCASAVDDQLVDDAIERCFGLLQVIADEVDETPPAPAPIPPGQTRCIKLPKAVAAKFRAKVCHS